MEVWTETLSPGFYRLADGRKLRITAEDVRNAVERGNEMIAAGLRVPGCWEHDLSAFPEYKSNPKWFLAKGYYGDAKQFRLNSGRAEALMSFADPKDFNQFKKVGSVSPRVVFNRIDERGKKWAGLTIAHVASTPTPVQRDQKRVPFDFSATAESAPRTGHYDLSGNAMPDLNDTSADSGTSTGGGDVISKAITMLEGIVALLKHGAGGGESKADPENPETDEITEDEGGAGDDVGSATNATSPMVMSQLPAALQLQAKGAVESHRKNMIEETKKFFRSGRLNKTDANAHIHRLRAADLSLTNGWELRPTPIVVEHRAYAKLTTKPGWKPEKDADMSALGTVETPKILRGETDNDAKERDANALEFALKRANLLPAK